MKCRPVTEFGEKLNQLLDDMHETLEQANGVGLAAPQVGYCRRFFIMHLGDVKIEAINPEIKKIQRQTVRAGGLPFRAQQVGLCDTPEQVQVPCPEPQGRVVRNDTVRTGSTVRLP